jgi:hypothetical protein
MPRPTDGDVVFTDYYGPVGGGSDKANYYGRSYEFGAQEFNRNRLVEDSAYMKVQANMTGINTLRTRPGVAMQSTILQAADPEVGG